MIDRLRTTFGRRGALFLVAYGFGVLSQFAWPEAIGLGGWAWVTAIWLNLLYVWIGSIVFNLLWRRWHGRRG